MALPKTFVVSAVLAAAFIIHPAAQAGSINAGGRTASPTVPFTSQAVAEFNTPWAIGFLPDGRLLVTEKLGRIFHSVTIIPRIHYRSG